MYDAIVVGARCAGSPTAMLLARKGYRVLLVDRARFPSDTISTHILWPHGAEALARWGLLDALAATGLPPICRRMSLDVGPFVLRGTIRGANGGRGGFCPRRTILDGLLVNAAARSGAEVRESFTVDDLLFADGAFVGLRGRGAGGKQVEERARIVIGADGVHSFVAAAVRAPEYDTRPIAVCAYYSYFSGVRQEDLELYLRERCAFGGAPTHDGLHLVMVNWPARRFAEVRADVEAHVAQALALASDFGARVSQGTREERWYGVAGVPGYFRRPYGAGWALVGDAGYCKDPMTAQGISDSFIDAERLVEALDAGLSGRGPLEDLLAAHEAARNERVRPMYELTNEIATLEPPPPPLQALFAALQHNQPATDAYLSAMTGATPLPEFMSEENVARIIDAARAGTSERDGSSSRYVG
ncbi:NAD(P)/FAD-dependent oxidoreductase [Anaeromyxobacter sp. SG17]|uniref:NAD(P)/FAD-dependent oxidoreductase n=1 Tax=Anaeromyxobacter sp. SG17 TaxID=2925405 RepID=UPI001F57F37F|nr:NAD(P)/FAD-dependent oxidoreductase [Anaeromyxobacter sp. SG17]